MITVTVTGLPEIDAKLRYLHDVDANKIAIGVCRAGINRAAANIRRHIPRKIRPRSPDKGIGTSVKRKRDGATAKAGVGVGASQRKALNVVNRGKRKGVGVSARNLHWFALGTADRWTGSKRDRSKLGKGRRISTGKARRYVGAISKAKFGGFVQNFGQMDVESRMRQRFDALIKQAAAGGIRGAAEVAEM